MVLDHDALPGENEESPDLGEVETSYPKKKPKNKINKWSSNNSQKMVKTEIQHADSLALRRSFVTHKALDKYLLNK